ncbi:YbdK family carboxylate-amine ligase [Ramlibacter monticola]|uniref:Putative glutamate--cysteine ligase 2 n=1 Tax=Ramlibacter monticola TaxID=1926872 RepID=A0A936Z078_9BURK|nr:YbdK family carboxylate-amine ligase [Ramlibacter monticola]MBL0392723.1 glutamate--cysteine ligase [Ramlibacter monticola]
MGRPTEPGLHVPASVPAPTPAPAPELEPFRQSAALSLGVELELQLVNTHDYDLAPYSAEMLRLVEKVSLPGSVVPEMTSSMIEFSTDVCHSASEVLGQLTIIRDALVRCADKLNIACVGGGTHPFQQWHEQRIYDRPRFRQLSELYGYLSKQFTIFGQHVHVGCPDADSALLMLHRMSRYIPHFIALSASSPFVQGQDTQFDSARLNSVFAFPMSGRAPFTLRWSEFARFFAKSTRTGVIKSMKDFYWDIRPKPEYGTIEIRVFDTPLTIERAAALAGLVQSLGAWFLQEQPFVPEEDDYMVYTYNRFQACRFGLEAVYVDPPTGEHLPLREHILLTLDRVAPHARELGAGAAIEMLRDSAERGVNDALWLRETQGRERLLAEMVRQAAERFRGRQATG